LASSCRAERRRQRPNSGHGCRPTQRDSCITCVGAESLSTPCFRGRYSAMAEFVVSDAAIAAMTPAERRELITRLEMPLDELVPPDVLARHRRLRLG
jgi:hypothetical protein